MMRESLRAIVERLGKRAGSAPGRRWPSILWDRPESELHIRFELIFTHNLRFHLEVQRGKNV
jgi:hypothetical protein